MGLTWLSTGQLLAAKIEQVINDTIAYDLAATVPATRAELELARTAGRDFLAHWLAAQAIGYPPIITSVLDWIISDMDRGIPPAGFVTGATDRNYDWATIGACIWSKLPDIAHDEVDGWAMIIWDGHSVAAPNTALEVRDFRLLGLTDRWSLIASTIYGSRVNDPNFGSAQYGSAGRGPVFVCPPNRGVRFYHGMTRYPAGIKGIVSTFEARLVRIDTSKPDDRAYAKLLVNAGADWRSRANPGNIQAAMCSRLKLATNEWQRFGATTLVPTELRASGFV
jgi:hypothetical protein